MRFENGLYGRRAVITSAWTPGMSRDLLAHDVRELELIDAKGWRGSDLSFLEELPQLKAFKIIDFNIPSVEPIHFLHQLRALEVTTYCKTPLRFAEFPELEDCGLEWRPKSESLFSCTTLRKLFLNRYSGKDTDAFSKLVNLETLAILNAPVENLRGLGTLSNLKSLRLANLRRLSSLAGIAGLVELEELNLDTCPAVGSIAAVGGLVKLRKLQFSNSGEIDSLEPLGNLRGLEVVVFDESTNIRDGDLSPLLHQKNLSRIGFRNRSHYSHRREDFGQAYFGAELMEEIKRRGGKPLSDREMVARAMGTSLSEPFWRRILGLRSAR